jgi:hypothetical protein
MLGLGRLVGQHGGLPEYISAVRLQINKLAPGISNSPPLVPRRFALFSSQSSLNYEFHSLVGNLLI